MTTRSMEFPLVVDGHAARVVITPLDSGGWHVQAEVDGRTIGWHEYTHWQQVERFRQRMQRWLSDEQNTARHQKCA